MDFVQTTQNPWGQDVLVRISWDLFWAALIGGAVFVVFHLALRARLAKRQIEVAEESVPVAGVPERVERHNLTSRLFHWVMAVAMLVLVITGFLPQVGVQFSWVTAHWIAGVVLVASIAFHMVHATVFQSLRNVWIGGRDMRELIQEIRHTLTSRGARPPRAGKYPVDHKLFHHLVVLAGFAAIITGVVMMVRIDQPLLTRNPYLFGDGSWGWIYVLHGLGGVALVGMIIAHIYFAVLPEKLWLTRSMIFGWVTREKFLEHHDPERWEPQAPGGGDGSETGRVRAAEIG